MEKCQRCLTDKALFRCPSCDKYQHLCDKCDSYLHSLNKNKMHQRFPLASTGTPQMQTQRNTKYISKTHVNNTQPNKEIKNYFKKIYRFIFL